MSSGSVQVYALDGIEEVVNPVERVGIIVNRHPQRSIYGFSDKNLSIFSSEGSHFDFGHSSPRIPIHEPGTAKLCEIKSWDCRSIPICNFL